MTDKFEKACEQLFRGFIPTNNKHAKMKFKDVENLPTLDDVRSMQEYAGVLRKGVLLLDFDNIDHGMTFQKMCIDAGVKYTSIKTNRGVHFYFKGDGLSATVGAFLACGLEADIKSGEKNGYSIIKFSGVEREVVEYHSELTELPFWAKPIKNFGELELFGMKEGDGRNQTLFRYILDLRNNGYSNDEIKLIIRVVNEYTFAEPLDNNEIRTLLRNESFPENDNDEKTNDSDELPKSTSKRGRSKIDIIEVGNKFIQDCQLKVIDGQIRGYNGKIYTSNRTALAKWFYATLGSVCSTNTIRELWAYVEAQLVGQSVETDPRYIAFNNGVYDIVENKLLDFDAKYNITNIIPHNYNPNAYNADLDKMLNSLACNDTSVRSLLEECVGYCFYRANELSKAFLLIGDKSNGKSTFLSLIHGLLGQDNVSSLDLGQLGERFNTAMLSGKLANIGDDISDEFCRGDTVAMFKKVVSGNKVQGEFKGQTPFMFSPKVKMLFSANQFPRMKGSEEAIARRLIIIPFNAQFNKNNPDYDPYIIYKIKTEDAYEYLIQIALDGLYEMLANNEFTKCAQADDMLAQFKNLNDNMIEYMDDNEFLGRSIIDCYTDYCGYCTASGYTPVGKNTFSSRIHKRFGYVSKVIKINNKPVRIFGKSEVSKQ